jgi:hypothetical protein
MCPEELTLSLYFDHELNPEEMREVTSHLDKCPECREKVEAFGRTSGVLASLVSEPDPETGERIKDRILHSTRYRQNSFRRSRFIRLPLPVAAAAAAMFLVLAVWRFIPRQDINAPVASSELQDREQVLEESPSPPDLFLNPAVSQPDREVVDNMLRSRLHEELVNDGQMSIPLGFSESEHGQPVLTRVARFQEDQY